MLVKQIQMYLLKESLEVLEYTTGGRSLNNRVHRNEVKMCPVDVLNKLWQLEVAPLEDV